MEQAAKEAEESKEQTSEQKQSKTEEKDWKEIMINTIAKDNQMLRELLKFLVNPFVLLAGLIVVGFWFFKSNEDKEKLQQQNNTLKEALGDLNHDFKKWRKKNKKEKKSQDKEEQTEPAENKQEKNKGYNSYTQEPKQPFKPYKQTGDFGSATLS